MSYKAIKALKPVKAGDDLLSVITAERINTIQAILLALWEGQNLAGGTGVSITRGSTVTISANVEDITAGMTGSAVCNEDGTITITFGQA